MKPISITMQGFGSYIQSTTIDFSSLGENPIFLIPAPREAEKQPFWTLCALLYIAKQQEDAEVGPVCAALLQMMP